MSKTSEQNMAIVKNMRKLIVDISKSKKSSKRKVHESNIETSSKTASMTFRTKTPQE